MCGFCGWIGKTDEQLSNQLDQSLISIEHRGPDNQGMFIDDNFGLGFRRLAIIDLTDAANQPLTYRDRYYMVFNGEIYNYLELKKKLIDRGETFSTNSDSEVLLRLLVIKGTRAISKLNGMFAFVFIDKLTGSFILGRDRLGQKPLYYSIDTERLYFASEIQALNKLDQRKRKVDAQSLTHYLCYNYTAGSNSIYQNCKRLVAGCIIEGNINVPVNLTVRKYWEISPDYVQKESQTTDKLIEEFESIFKNACAIRLRADVPIGVFLSGGIDSGLVTAFSSKSDDKKLRSFSVSFDQEGYNEKEQARRVGSKFDLEFIEIKIAMNNLKDLDLVASIYDEPFADCSALPTYHLCKKAAEYGKVFITGDGGDEFFGGYRHYQKARELDKIFNAPKSIKNLALGISKIFPRSSSISNQAFKLSLPKSEQYAYFNFHPQSPILKYIFKNQFLNQFSTLKFRMDELWASRESNNFTFKQQLADQNSFLPDDVLVKIDRASMKNSIELRSPFLDYRLVEWANCIETKHHINKNNTKLLLRKIAQKYLPRQTINMKKMGFGVPIQTWFSEASGKKFLKERLLDPSFVLKDIIKMEHLEKSIEQKSFFQGYNNSDFFWKFLVFDSWAKYNHVTL